MRISKYKNLFEKGYTPSWTTEIFKIRKVENTNPVTYLLEDYTGREVQGGFYEKELMNTKFQITYLIEKTIRRDKDRIFVKWLGFDKSHNG